MMKCATRSMLLFPPVSKAPLPAISEKYKSAIAKLPCAVTRLIAKRRSTPMQAMNDLHLVLRSEECESFGQGREWTFVSDGGWDHNPHNGEVQLALTLDHLERECTSLRLLCVLRECRRGPRRCASTRPKHEPHKRHFCARLCCCLLTTTSSRKMHWTRTGNVSKLFLLPELVGHNTQSSIFAVLCLT